MFFINSRNKKINDKFLTLIKLTLTILDKYWHSVNLFYSKTYTRGVFRTHPIITIRLFAQQTFLVFQDVFSITLFVFQDVFKTCLQDVLQLCLQDVLEDKKMLHWRRLHQDECLLGVIFTNMPHHRCSTRF